MPSRSKQKGNRFEREVTNLAKEYSIESKRAYASNGLSLGHTEEVDVLLEGDLRIQAKCRKKIATWLKPSDVVDAVVVKEDRGETYIILRFDEFLDDYNKFLTMKGKKDAESGL